jgi:hypothetical protein
MLKRMHERALKNDVAAGALHQRQHRGGHSHPKVIHESRIQDIGILFGCPVQKMNQFEARRYRTLTLAICIHCKVQVRTPSGQLQETAANCEVYRMERA